MRQATLRAIVISTSFSERILFSLNPLEELAFVRRFSLPTRNPGGKGKVAPAPANFRGCILLDTGRGREGEKVKNFMNRTDT